MKMKPYLFKSLKKLDRLIKHSTGLLIIFVFVITSFSCSRSKVSVLYDFNKIPDRIWPGEDFWTIPIEDWQVKNGRVETTSKLQNASFSVLPYVLSDNNEAFKVSLKLGLSGKGENEGSAGLILGAEAIEEKDVRSAVYFGKGTRAGINTKGFAFLGLNTKPLPDSFSFDQFRITAEGRPSRDGYTVKLTVFDSDDNPVIELNDQPENPVTGIIKIVNNFVTSESENDGPAFWYDDLKLTGPKFENQPGNRFGPVLWTMYTLSRNVLKMTAQLPPVGISENQEAILEIKEEGRWKTIQTEKMDPDARTATFKITAWDNTTEKDYRILFKYIDAIGKADVAEYEGKICTEPEGRPLRMGALTCQYHYGFPYSPLVKNLKLSNPDILYFSGDQIYEPNGGYPIKRDPEDTAILNYLGKWFMFGWAFGDLMRDVPTICTPDDHDVFHGNVWGGGGVRRPPGYSQAITLTGFDQTVKFVNVVNRTQCAHLPDPFDPTPIEQGMSVWYTSLNYGRISFAIVSDRVFKTGPTEVAYWEGRKDWIRDPVKDPSVLDKPGLELLGERQERFLEEWIQDWNNVDMKVLLSQTLFANVATHHGRYNDFLVGDMDSGGWPQTPRDRALRIMRKAFVFHIAGDQHVTSVVQYGIDEYRDAGWCFVTPAIAVGYSRWFRPDEMGFPVKNRPKHGLPDTGEYQDAFGNLNYVYAIGNPVNFTQLDNRYELAQVKGSGYGMIIFDRKERTIKMESWHFLANLSDPKPEDQFPGWPLTISQFDNHGKRPVAWLPQIKVTGEADPVIKVINNSSGETEYIVRIKGNEFNPWVFEKGTYTIDIGYPEKNIWKKFDNLSGSDKKDGSELIVTFNP